MPTLSSPSSLRTRFFPRPAHTRDARPAGDRRAADVATQEVTGDELLAALNRELSSHPECEGMRLGAARWERDTHVAGCNWSETSLIVRVHGTVGPPAFAVLREILADARARYDVRLED